MSVMRVICNRGMHRPGKVQLEGRKVNPLQQSLSVENAFLTIQVATWTDFTWFSGSQTDGSRGSVFATGDFIAGDKARPWKGMTHVTPDHHLVYCSMNAEHILHHSARDG